MGLFPGEKPAMERRLVAILAADVVGYSRMMQADEAGTFQRFLAHRKELLEPEIEKRHGRIFKLMGDGLLAEFGSVVDALECAAILQRSMAQRNQDIPQDRRIDLRIGVNVGDVIVENEDRHGDGVNIAARLQQLADPGGIVVSQTVLDHASGKLAIDFESLGSHAVKNIAKPIPVYRAKLEGVRKGRANTAERGKGSTWIWLGIAVVALLVAAGGAFWFSDGLQRSAPIFDKPSVAVLPFDNLGDDAKWDRFADGLTEDIITDLALSKTLYVIARNSTSVYKGKGVDIRQVGRDLGVEYVLEGSIQATGNQMRVTAQLINATSGSHVWLERYDRPAHDIFAVQSELTEKIAATITGYEGAIAETERAMAHRKAPQNLTAFDYYLLGMEAKHGLTKEGFLKADELFRKALELDPQLARAHVGIVQTYALLIDAGFVTSVSELLDKQMESAQRAVALDPKDGETHLALAIAYSYRGEMERAAAEFGRAEEFSPNNADLLVICAWTWPALGHPERGVELAERALQLNPHYPEWYVLALRSVYLFAGNFDKAVEYANLVKTPFAIDYAFIAISEAYRGDIATAKSASLNVLRLDPDWTAEGWISAQGGFARDKESDLFAVGAQRAGLPMCVTDTKLKQQPDIVRLKICDEQRTGNITK